MNKIITDIDSFHPFLQFVFVKTHFYARHSAYKYTEDNGFSIQCVVRVQAGITLEQETTLEDLLENKLLKLISLSIFSKRGNSFYVPEEL